MNEPNPHQPPASPVVPAREFPVTGRAVDAGRGWEWIAEGFALFKKQPGIWILILLVLVVCFVMLNFLPVVGSLAGMLLMQVFMGGVMLGCRALDDGEPLEISCVFSGFQKNTGDLVVLGVLALVGWVIAFIPAIVIAGGGAFFAMMRGGGDLVSVGALGFTFMLAMLVSFALALPLYMALWFAPSLIVFNDLKPVAALKASFFGCMKNIVPFLIYGVVLLVLCLVAAIPLALGFLVLGPVAIASIYTGYKDVFAVE